MNSESLFIVNTIGSILLLQERLCLLIPARLCKDQAFIITVA